MEVSPVTVGPVAYWMTTAERAEVSCVCYIHFGVDSRAIA